MKADDNGTHGQSRGQSKSDTNPELAGATTDSRTEARAPSQSAKTNNTEVNLRRDAGTQDGALPSSTPVRRSHAVVNPTDFSKDRREEKARPADAVLKTKESTERQRAHRSGLRAGN